MKNTFKPVLPQVNFPQLEEEMIAYWKANKIFEKSIESRPKDRTWTFLDGPPFVTGMPHYGTLLSSIPKDVFGRYWTMKGYRVRRVWGWDGHGLPIENKVETKLKIRRKKDIENVVGVGKFIQECLSYVQTVSEEWEWYVDHIGRWVDFSHAYKTWDTPYMESVMWVFKQMYVKGHIYKGLRVSLYCPHCSTPISNFEVAMDPDNYKDVTEPTAVYMYQSEESRETYYLAWSTTPWNKLATPALAVNPKMVYVRVLQGGKHYILAKSTLKMVTDDPFSVEEEFLGSTLIGKKFIPHYTFYPIEPGNKSFIIVPGDFVTADEGTGIVTIAAYGEEDLAVMKAEHIQLVMHIDDEGMVKPEVPKWGGLFYLDTDPLILEDLSRRGLIYRVDSYTHSIPTCWRCHTRLMYAPQDAWYVNIQALKKKLAETNESVNWFPSHFKYGRYLKSLEAAPDWCISRSRYWGSPVPVWECVCGERFVPGSIAELEERSGKKINDLHKPVIDEVIVTCARCGKKVHRVSEVLDSWIEAGSASFAERHFPFDPAAGGGKDALETFFPPDFIVEYTGQIRAWFYVLHVISTALYNAKAFKNVVVTGVILGTDGRKMSKNYGNYPDPKEMIIKYGGDALRLYLMGSPIMHGEDIRISEEQYRDQVRGLMLVLWNVYNFFVTYAYTDGWKNPVGSRTFHVMHEKDYLHDKNVLDLWILDLLEVLKTDVTNALDSYDTVTAVDAIGIFVTHLSQWYVRRSRDRIGPSVEPSDDKQFCYETLFKIIVTISKLLAPLTPFLSDSLYRNLTGEESVHLADWPEISQKSNVKSQTLNEAMLMVRRICELTHALRKELKIKVRQPLQKLTVSNAKIQLEKTYLSLIRDELNVKEVEFVPGKGELSVDLDTTITMALKAEGEARELIREIQILRKEKGCKIDERIDVQLPESYATFSKEVLSDIQRQTLANRIIWSQTVDVILLSDQ